MRPIHSLAVALAVLLATVALSACSLSKETQARLAIANFSASCPAQMKAEFAKDANFASLGDGGLGNVSSDTCTCITAKLRLLPVEKVIALDNSSSQTKEIETLVSPCAAIAMRPHIGDLCMAGVKQAGGDPAVAGPRCACVQRKVAAMDDATIETTFSDIEKGFSDVADRCIAEE